MTYHDNAKTTVHQRKRIRQSKAPYRVQARELGVSAATVAKWKHRADPRDRPSRPRRIRKALPPEAAPLLGWMRRDWLLDLDTIWLALRQTVFPQLSRSAVYRELVRLQLHQLKALRPPRQRRQSKFRACPPGFLHVDVFYLPRLDRQRRYLFVAIDRATRLLTTQVSDTRETASALAFLAHCQRFYPFRLYRILTDNGRVHAADLPGPRGGADAPAPPLHAGLSAGQDPPLAHEGLPSLDERPRRAGRQHDQDRDGLSVPFRHGRPVALGPLWVRTLLQLPSALQGDRRQDPVSTDAGMVCQITAAVPPRTYRAVHNVVRLDT